MFARRSVGWVAAVVLAFISQTGAASALSSGQATFTLRTGSDSAGRQDFVVDSNQCPSSGPVSMHVGGVVTNTSGGTLYDVTATLSGPTLAGGQAATITIGALAAGQSYFVAWFVTYSCTDGATGSATVTLADKNSGTVARSLTTSVRAAQSANAGGKVTSTTLGAGAVVGQVITADVTYEFGSIGSGSEFFLQPAGSTAFNASCFRLMGASILSSGVNAISAGTANTLYFLAGASQSGAGNSASVRYSYRYLCANSTTVARPFAAQTSGSTNIKDTGNYDGAGALVFSFPGATNPFMIAKSANPILFTSNQGGIATYTVTISNPSAYATTIDEIADVLPANVSFTSIGGTSGVIAANSSAVPASGATGTIRFKANIGSSYAIPAGGSISLVYTATIPSAAGTYANSASAAVGLESIGTAAVSIDVTSGGALVISKSVAMNAAGDFAIPG